jgi:hypothetical protein
MKDFNQLELDISLEDLLQPTTDEEVKSQAQETIPVVWKIESDDEESPAFKEQISSHNGYEEANGKRSRMDNSALIQSPLNEDR